METDQANTSMMNNTFPAPGQQDAAPVRLVLAVDGGQSHSLAIVADASGRVLGAGKGGPANHFMEPGGPERFRGSMSDCVRGAFAEASLPSPRVDASYYALTGVHEQMPTILQQVAPSGLQTVAGDKEASLVGGTLERPAALVLAGTGAIACAVDASGNESLTGGWGYYMGDEGSASWIAPRALSAATQAEDGRGPATALATLIPRHFGVATLRELHPLIYTHKIDRVQLAGIAGVAGAAAGDGDEVSQQLLAQAGQYLGTAVVTVLRRVSLVKCPVPVTSAGGVFKAGASVIDPMMARIHADCPLAYYEPPHFPPIIGALFLALRSIGVSIGGDIIAAVRASESVWQARK
jgi:glucosamine kinase